MMASLSAVPYSLIFILASIPLSFHYNTTIYIWNRNTLYCFQNNGVIKLKIQSIFTDIDIIVELLIGYFSTSISELLRRPIINKAIFCGFSTARGAIITFAFIWFVIITLLASLLNGELLDHRIISPGNFMICNICILRAISYFIFHLYWSHFVTNTTVFSVWVLSIVWSYAREYMISFFYGISRSFYLLHSCRYHHQFGDDYNVIFLRRLFDWRFSTYKMRRLPALLRPQTYSYDIS